MWLVKHVARRSRSSDWRGYFLIACLAVLALLLAGASWSALRSERERTAADESQEHTLQVLLETDELRTATLSLLRGERGYLLTHDESFLQPYIAGRKRAAQSYAELERLTADNPKQQIRIGRLERELAHLDEVLAQLIALERGGEHQAAVARVKAGDGRAAVEMIMGELDGIEATERALLADRAALARTTAGENETYQYLLAGIGLALLLLTLVATVYVRRAVDAEAVARRELHRFATTDALTDLPNRRSFIDALGRSIARASADPGRKLCLAIFDIDHFKKINDRFGHPAGDDVIREVAIRALEALRKRDLVGRIGGEEFAVLFPAAGMETAREISERLREAFSDKPVRSGPCIIPFTASIGIAEWQAGDDIDRLMARADEALYAAKNGGRNQVRLAA